MAWLRRRLSLLICLLKRRLRGTDHLVCFLQMWRLRLWIRIRVVSWGLIKLANSGSGVLLWWKVISKTKKATASTIDSEGWLKTGDVCYNNSEGFVFAVDRLKELSNATVISVASSSRDCWCSSNTYPDTKAWQYPMAYIIRTAGINLSESEIIILVAKQVFSTMQTMFYN